VRKLEEEKERKQKEEREKGKERKEERKKARGGERESLDINILAKKKSSPV
jgi:hypothetical protein